MAETNADLPRVQGAMDARRSLERAGLLGPDLELVVLFGSIASGRPRRDSDVDIGVDGRGLWDQLALGAAIGDALGREAHVVDLGDASERLRFEVASKGVLVWEGTPGAWARFKMSAMLRYWDLIPTIARTAEGVRARLLREARDRQERRTHG